MLTIELYNERIFLDLDIFYPKNKTSVKCASLYSFTSFVIPELTVISVTDFLASL